MALDPRLHSTTFKARVHNAISFWKDQEGKTGKTSEERKGSRQLKNAFSRNSAPPELGQDEDSNPKEEVVKTPKNREGER